jgi:hypothetical protein
VFVARAIPGAQANTVFTVLAPGDGSVLISASVQPGQGGFTEIDLPGQPPNVIDVTVAGPTPTNNGLGLRVTVLTRDGDVAAAQCTFPELTSGGAGGCAFVPVL